MNAKELGNQPHLPCTYPVGDNWAFCPGFTKREYISALAMQGMCSNPTISNTDPSRTGAEVVAEAARIMADALLAELAKDQT